MYLGDESGAILPEADLILVLDSAVPWIPRIGQDETRRQDRPSVGRPAGVRAYPFRDFDADLDHGSSPAAVLTLQRELTARLGAQRERVERRAASGGGAPQGDRGQRAKPAETARSQPHPSGVAAALHRTR